MSLFSTNMATGISETINKATRPCVVLEFSFLCYDAVAVLFTC